MTPMRAPRANTKKNIPTTLLGQSNFRVLEIVSGRYEQFRERRFIEPHRRNIYSFFFVKTGFIRHSIDFRTYTCAAGNVFFMAPRQVYLVDSADDFGGISVTCKTEWLSSAEIALPIIQNNHHVNILTLAKPESGYVRASLENMLHEFSNPGLFTEQILRSCFTALLAYFSRIYQQLYSKSEASEAGSDLLQKFWSLVDAHWNEFGQVNDYASRLFISSSHLNRVIRENTGKTAIEWIQEKKMTEAKRLLLHGKESIKEIAYELGFSDPAYFNRFFKKWNAGTPQQFRDEMREKYKEGR